MSVNVTSDPFTDDEVLFATKDAANAWRNSLTVPSATLAEEGVMKKVQLPAAANAASSQNAVNVIDEAGGITQTVSLESFLSLRGQLDALQTKFNALLTALTTAGHGE